MRIGINGYYLTTQFSGIGQYTINLLKSLAEIDRENKYYVFSPAPVEWNFPSNFKLKIISPLPFFQKTFLNRFLWEEYQLGHAIKKYKIEVLLLSFSFLISIVSLILFFYNQTSQANDEEFIQPVEEISQPVNQKIYVDISGAVVKPDVYKLSFGARVKDVLNLAGGFSEEADKAYFIRNFNLARIVSDQEKIYVPSAWEITSGIFVETPQLLNNLQTSKVETSPLTMESLISINEASEQELDQLPGIGKVTATKIINNRPYSNLEDLLNKKVVGKSVFEKIKDLIEI